MLKLGELFIQSHDIVHVKLLLYIAKPTCRGGGRTSGRVQSSCTFFLGDFKGPGKEQQTVCYKIIKIIRFSMEAISSFILIY